MSVAKAGRRRSSNTEPMQAGLVPEDVRAQTPTSRGTKMKQAEAPSTPNLEASRSGMAAGLATPEATFAPKPCRAFPGSPGGVSLPDSNSVIDDAAQQELRELLGVGGGEAHRRIIENGKQGVKSEQTRPLSSVSTSAGPTPSPDDRTSPNFAVSAPVGGSERRDATKFNAEKAFSRPNRQANDVNASRDGKQAMPSQIRKIFVGGVPQDMQQDDLFKLFSEYAQVKKAWLQRYRDATKVKSSASHNHRGFGFVIFQDSSAVDQLLGVSHSRFIPLKDGRKLEVKRAVSSSDMTTPGDDVPEKSHPLRGQVAPQQASPAAPAAMGAAASQRNVNGFPQQLHQQQQLAPIPDGAGAGSLRNGMQPPPPMQGCWPADPRAAWLNQTPPIQQPQGMLLAPNGQSPWPTHGGEGAMPPQSMSPPPQQMQQLFPAVAGVPLAAPTAVRAPAGVVVSGYSSQIPPNGLSWIPTSHTPPPMPIPTAVSPVPGGMPCNSDGSAPPQMQPLYNAWGQWAPLPGSPTPPPQAQHMQQMPQQPFQQQSQMAWQQQQPHQPHQPQQPQQQQPQQQMHQVQYTGS